MVEVTVLKLLRLEQGLFGAPDHVGGLGVLHYETGHHFPPFVCAWKTKSDFLRIGIGIHAIVS